MKNRKTARGNRCTPRWAERGSPRGNGVIETGVLLVSARIAEATWDWVEDHLLRKLKRHGCLPLASPQQGEEICIGESEKRLLRYVMGCSWSSKPSGAGKSHVLAQTSAHSSGRST